MMKTVKTHVKLYRRWLRRKLYQQQEKLSRKQRMRLVVGLLALFILGDALYIVQGFSGNTKEMKVEYINTPDFTTSPKHSTNEADSVHVNHLKE